MSLLGDSCLPNPSCSHHLGLAQCQQSRDTWLMFFPWLPSSSLGKLPPSSTLFIPHAPRTVCSWIRPFRTPAGVWKRLNVVCREYAVLHFHTLFFHGIHDPHQGRISQSVCLEEIHSFNQHLLSSVMWRLCVGVCTYVSLCVHVCVRVCLCACVCERKV